MSVEIKYKGSPIAVLEEGEKVTIHCDGKFMEEDIVVTTILSEADEPTEETYTLSGTDTYKFNETFSAFMRCLLLRKATN